LRVAPILPLLVLAGLSACAEEGSSAPPTGGTPPSVASGAPVAPTARVPPSAHTRIDGRDFPDHVIALTWDDGPDVHTLELAKYLHDQRVSATFFVVSDWVDGVSSDPGDGNGVFETGHTWLPMLGDLVSLGHRLGNHTAHHVLLGDADPAVVVRELAENQRSIDPFLTNELRLFRAPGGSWSEEAARAVDSDPFLASTVGPFHWDIDRKDWEGSLGCHSDRKASECEPAMPWAASRVRPHVIAQRYLRTIESSARGIVLFHDRVGNVGSRYALDIARELIPQLEARGFVFAAPVLRFSPPLLRAHGAFGSLAITDVDGDGQGDLCDATGCALATTTEIAGEHVPRTLFGPKTHARAHVLDTHAHDARGATAFADVDGDGIADACTRTRDGLQCARGTSHGFGRAERWSTDLGRELRFGDLNGDGRADVCSYDEPNGHVLCAFSTGRSFTRATVWLGARIDGASWTLGDINGDGRADLCTRAPGGVQCALAP
jgi:peptidoglycan/xylan/chitin deacetylase (PgdA/CDA1 family)